MNKSLSWLDAIGRIFKLRPGAPVPWPVGLSIIKSKSTIDLLGLSSKLNELMIIAGLQIESAAKLTAHTDPLFMQNWNKIN
jgi:hypothetical protein